MSIHIVHDRCNIGLADGKNSVSRLPGKCREAAIGMLGPFRFLDFQLFDKRCDGDDSRQSAHRMTMFEPSASSHGNAANLFNLTADRSEQFVSKAVVEKVRTTILDAKDHMQPDASQGLRHRFLAREWPTLWALKICGVESESRAFDAFDPGWTTEWSLGPQDRNADRFTVLPSSENSCRTLEVTRRRGELYYQLSPESPRGLTDLFGAFLLEGFRLGSRMTRWPDADWRRLVSTPIR